MVQKQVYDERLFSLMARRADLARRVLRDGRLENVDGFRGINRMIERRAGRVSNLAEELVFEMAENMPELALNYGLLDKADDTHMRSGAPLLDTIRLARIASRVDFSDDLPSEFGSKVMQYVDGLFSGDSMSGVVLDNFAWGDLRRAVASEVFGFYDAASESLSGMDVPDGEVYRMSVPPVLTSFVTHLGKVPVPSHMVRGASLGLLDRMLVSEPEYDFAGENDSWNLFRGTYLGRPINSFGLVNTNLVADLPVYVVNHSQTNTLRKVRELNSDYTSPPNFVEHSYASALDRFNEEVNPDGKMKLAVYSVFAGEYGRKKVEWYQNLLERFGRVSTIRSMHGDDSLNLRKYELPTGRASHFQNLDVESVNLHLRKVVNMGRVLGGYDIPVEDAYRLTVPILNNYRREAFESNIGMMVSDISSFSEAKGWLFLPTYLDPSTYPSIGVSASRVGPGEPKINIAVRSSDVSSLMGVRESVYSTFGQVRDLYSA